jgi:hypothetical protein
MLQGLSKASDGSHATPHPNPPPQGGRGPEKPEIRLRLTPSPLVGEGWGGGAMVAESTIE